MGALKKGQMTVFMAGDKVLAEQMRPLMKACFQTIIYTGEFGTAMIPKVLSNMLTVVEIIALGEVLMIAKRAGLDMKTFWNCIRASAGNSFFGKRAARWLCKEHMTLLLLLIFSQRIIN